MILGVAVYTIAKAAGWAHPEAWIFFPLVVRAFGLLSTIVAIFFVRGREDEDPMNMLNRGYWVTTILSVVGLLITTNVMMQTGSQSSPNGLPTWVWFFGAGVVGLATSVAFVYITQFYTAGSYRPVREIAEASKTGPATNIISGVAVGFETTFATAITIGIALFASHWLGSQAGLIDANGNNVGGIFGTAVATMGMLMTTAYVLAMDTFGPITDNAGGIAEFSRAEAGAREITDRLDAVGNTTKALTKGYAIASASLAAFLLFSAYIDKVNLILGRQIAAGQSGVKLLTSVDLSNVNVFIAALLAAMLVYFFSSLAIRAVGKTAQSIIVEVRRQFREMPGIMDYTQRPDYARVVDITTRAALREMILPGVVAVGTPIIVGILLGYEAVAGMLMVGTIAGVMLATVLNNSGGAWDNAKKYIESGHLLDEAGATSWARRPTRTPRPSSATRSAIRSRTPPARRSTSSSSCWPRSPWSSPRCSSASAASPAGRDRGAVRPADGASVRPVPAGPRRPSVEITFQALIMGIVQGLTEFLPVSSSGHLVIVPALLGWTDPFITSLAFSVMLHLGTLVALLVYFRADWLAIVPAGIAALRERSLRDRPEPQAGLAAARVDDPGGDRRADPQRPPRGGGADGRRRGRGPGHRRGDPVAGRPGRAQGGRARQDHLPARLRHRTGPGDRPRAGHQPGRDHDLGRPVRGPHPRGGGPLQLPDGDPDHRRGRALRGAQAAQW